MELFKKYLKEHGLSCTETRLDIAKAAFSFDDLFSADELFDRVRNSGCPVSKASLYRSLPILIDSGIIQPVESNQFHNHIFRKCVKTDDEEKIKCEECGMFVNINQELFNVFQQIPMEKYSLKEIVESFLLAKGNCPTCIEKFQLLDSSKNKSTKRRIILLEDNLMVRSLITTFLEDLGHEVFSYNNPSEFHLDCKCNPNPKVTCAYLLLVDIKMPEMNGIDFIKHQISKKCRIDNIAFISAHWKLDYIEFAESIGAAIFYKPFDINDLKNWIDSNIPEVSKDRVLGNEFLGKE